MNRGFKMRFKNLIAVILLATMVFVPYSLSWAMNPGELIVKMFDQSLKILKDPSLQGTDKTAERKQKLWELLAPVFNFDEISRRALGQHWKNHTDQEREEFTQIFTNVLKSTYLDRTDSYAGEKVILIKEMVKNNRSKVQTSFITKDGEKVAVDFSMKKASSRWRIYDVTVEGVSTVANYRSQFNSILSKSSFAELIKKLKEKETELSGL